MFSRNRIKAVEVSDRFPKYIIPDPVLGMGHFVSGWLRESVTKSYFWCGERDGLSLFFYRLKV